MRGNEPRHGIHSGCQASGAMDCGGTELEFDEQGLPSFRSFMGRVYTIPGGGGEIK